MGLQCLRCKQVKSEEEFSRDKTRETGRYPYCKDCVHIMRDNDVERERIRAYYRSRLESDPQFRAKNVQHVQIARYKSLYGITIEEYNILLEFQEGKCAICGRPPKNRRLAVDHDHKTGEVRGLLCMRCNQTLHERVDMEWLANAYEYLDVPPVFDALGRIPVGKRGRIKKNRRSRNVNPGQDGVQRRNVRHSNQKQDKEHETG